MIRPRQTLGDMIRAEAQASGMTVTDYVSTAMAHVMGRPDLAPTDSSQEVLPFQNTA